MTNMTNAKPARFEEILSLTLAVAGNLLLAKAFLDILRFPQEHIGTIWDFGLFTGSFIFYTEFISLVASVQASAGHVLETIAADAKKQQRIRLKRIGLIAFYGVFVAVMASSIGNVSLFLYFMVSLTAKFFSAKASQHIPRLSRIMLFAVILFLAAASLQFLWGRLFPIPSEVLALRPGEGEEFIHPQSSLVWGAVYFAVMAVTDVVRFWKSRKAPQGAQFA